MSGTTQSRRETASSMMIAAQDSFMRRGGAYEATLAHMRARGEIDAEYVYREYPKDVRIHKGKREVKCQTRDVDKQLIEWTETRDIVDTITVHSEEEEDRVLNGGKTSAQIEEERQSLILQARDRGIKYDPSWSKLRLQRELGIPVAKEETAAFDEVAELEAQVAKARRALALREELATLNAQLAAPEDDIDGLRAQLRDLGVKVDGRWSPARLRQELEQATAPATAA